jgi:hypothetical protein
VQLTCASSGRFSTHDVNLSGVRVSSPCLQSWGGAFGLGPKSQPQSVIVQKVRCEPFTPFDSQFMIGVAYESARPNEDARMHPYSGEIRSVQITTMKIFGELDLSEVLEAKRQQLVSEIEREQPNALLNLNESDYVKYLIEKYRIEPIKFDFEALQVSESERMVPIEDHPFDSGARYGRRVSAAYPRQVFRFHLPFVGDQELLKCRASQWILWSIDVYGTAVEISFELVNWRNDAESLKGEKDTVLRSLDKQNQFVTSDVVNFNSDLEERARAAIQNRKTIILKRLNTVEALGVPLRKANEVPQTFAVPIAPKQIAIKPAVGTTPYAPDPTLDNANYQNILSILHDVGVAMERTPSTYAQKQEEDLRDFLLMTLFTHYPNSTGESFNKEGKTDILVRHEGKNIFVGECKFWRGPKGYHDTINQVLRYLTWRDSKAAILLFINNKELNPVLAQIATSTPEHPCFVRLESKKQESWSQFEFRLESDATRNVHLAVMSFHFPPK